MKYTLDEKKVLKKLDIPDFKHMTKDKVVKFASMLPYMDPEIAKASLEQFPEFKALATDVVSEYRQMVNDALNSNDKSQEAYYTACNNIIASLQAELSNPEIDSDERARIEDKMIVVAGMIGEKDSENKKFILKILAVCGAVAGGALVAAVTLLGGNTDIQSFGSNKDDEDIIDGEYDEE